jgi:Zn-dependent protease with chaperone function
LTTCNGVFILPPMRQVALLLAMVLGIPLVAFGVARGMQAFAEADWRDALENARRPKIESQVDQLLNEGEQPTPDRQPLTPAQLDRLKLCVLCASPVTAAKLDLCTSYNRLGIIEKLAVVAFALGLALLVLIAIAGRIASLNRGFLIALFGPGLYLTVIALSVLIILDGIMTSGALYYGPASLLGSIRLKVIVLIGGIGILAASGVGAILIVQTTWKALKPPKTSFIGKSLPPTVYPQLWGWISEIAERIGITPPQNVVATLDMNFCVTDVGVRCLDGELAGRTLILSLPLSRILTPEELLAIVAHEMGHVHGRDTAYTKRFAPIYHGARASLATLTRTMNEEGWHGIALMPSYAILTYFLHAFASAERPIPS